MADRRLKAVAVAMEEDGGRSSSEAFGDDERRRSEQEGFAAALRGLPAEEMVDGVQLELSLGRRRGTGTGTGSSSSGPGLGDAHPLPHFPFRHWDLALNSSHFLNTDALMAGSDGAERAGDGSGDRDRDFQSKRLKVLAYAEFCNYTATSNSVAEASAPFSTAENNSQCFTVNTENTMIPCPVSNNGGVQKSRTTSSDGFDLDMSGTGDVADVELRMDLTEDLLHLVFSFLSQKDLCKAGAACRQWQAASMHEDYWRCLNFENTEISQQNFDAICRRYPNAIEVNIYGVHNSDVLVMGAMASLRRLETLILGKGLLADGFFLALTSCPALKSLSICDSLLGSSMQEISVYHDRLRELHIMKCRVLRVSIRCQQLQSLSLRRTSMAHAFLTCPQLHELDIASCHKLSDAGIRSAVTSCPLLTSLDMSACSCVSDDTLREIAFACPNLGALDASYCPNISLESVRLPMLIDLKLHNCEGITSASMSAILYCRMLETLQLVNCGLLIFISLDLPHLRSISLLQCRKLVDLNLQSSVLSYIQVARCSSLLRINITSNALQKLVLQKQESLTTLSLQCPNLQEVDLSDCESLTNSICKVLSYGGGCSMLKSLVLDNCENLTAVRLSSSSLVSLSLVGCRGMAVLELSCPNLQKVNLDGCDHLESASFCPVGLESLNLGICPKLSILQIQAPKMTALDLKGCGVLSQASINCPYLMSLDASFCRQFMDDSLSTAAASCPQIESLVLSSCVCVGYDGLSSLHWLRRLTLLDLSYTFLTNLQPVFDTCLQLVILKLSACKYLNNSSLDALYKGGALPALLELDLSYSSIGQSAIAELLAVCTNLVNVNLNGCANMHDLIWGSSECHSSEMPIGLYSAQLVPMENDDDDFRKPERLLEILNCIGCPSIKKVLIPSTARCFHLSKLYLNLSTNLKEVDISCSNLNYLNLSHCSSLEMLNLNCPRLTNLQLVISVLSNVTEVVHIILNAGKEDCNIQIRPSVSDWNPLQHFPAYAAQVTPTHCVYFFFFTVVIAGGTWACCKFGKMARRDGAGIPYQQLEMGTQPQSSSVLDDLNATDGWEQSWDDDWEEEVAVGRPSSLVLCTTLPIQMSKS